MITGPILVVGYSLVSATLGCEVPRGVERKRNAR
jgi:hypothetical protein